MPQFDIVTLGLQIFGLLLCLYFFYLYNITVIEIGIMEIKKISCFFLFFFMSLFFLGNPYFSLIIILGCFILYNWYYTKLTINSKFFLIFNIFIVTILIFIESNFLIIILFAIKLLLFLLVLNIFISLYNKKFVSFIKDVFILLGFYLLLLGIYISIIKIYFLDAISILASAPDTMVLFEGPPSKIFLSFKNLHFFNDYQNPLFVIDFSNDNQLTNLATQYSKFDTSKELFFYLSQMVILTTGSHLNLVFIII
jgi:hypothetical protein